MVVSEDRSNPASAVLPYAFEDVLTADLDTQLAALEALTESICSQDPDQVGGRQAAQASKRVYQACERLGGQRLGWISRIESDGLWALDMISSFPLWLAWHDRMPITAARRYARLARTLRDTLPDTAAGVRSGLITTDHATILAGIASSEPRREALRSPMPEEGTDQFPPGSPELRNGGADGEGGEGSEDGMDDSAEHPVRSGERFLLDLSRTYSLAQFGRLARRFAAVTDPDADDRGYSKAQEREYFDVTKTFGGYHVSGFLTDENGQLLRTAIEAVGGVPAADNQLTAAQRRAIALTGLARLILDKGMVGSGSAVRPHLLLLVSWTEFRALAARTGADIDAETGQRIDLASLIQAPTSQWEDGTGPIPRAVLDRIAADCSLTRIVFGPAGEILDIGRAERTFTGSRRKAVIARDITCVWPGCEAPPIVSEVHHALTSWAEGGRTSTFNAAILCWYHHRHVDGKKIPMRWQGIDEPHESGWEFGEPGTKHINGGVFQVSSPPPPPPPPPESSPPTGPSPSSGPARALPMTWITAPTTLRSRSNGRDEVA